MKAGLIVLALAILYGILVSPWVYTTGIEVGIWPEMTFTPCRYGWYDETRRTPHYGMVPTFGDSSTVCDAIPPCGDPPRHGAGAPCDTILEGHAHPSG